MTRPDETPRGDPWNAFGYLVAGVLTYGAIGYVLDLWWGTSFMVAIGIMVGAVLGLFMTWARFKAPDDTTSLSTRSKTRSTTRPSDEPSQ